MVHFDALIRQKQLFKETLLQNQKIVNLLCNTGNNVLEFEDIRLGSKSPAAQYIKTHFYIPNTTVVDKNFITMQSRLVYADTDVVKETQLIVYIICNNDQIDLLQGSRADLLANEVDQILNNGDNPLFGLGGITIGVATEMRFIEGYTGWQIPYGTHEMNRMAPLID